MGRKEGKGGKRAGENKGEKLRGEMEDNVKEEEEEGAFVSRSTRWECKQWAGVKELRK